MNASPSYFIVLSASALTVVLLFLLWVYNVVALWGMYRADVDESASPLSKVVWLMGFGAAFVLPCAPPLALVTMGLSWHEKRQVHSGASSLPSATPARMGWANALVALVLFAFMALASLVNLLL